MSGVSHANSRRWLLASVVLVVAVAASGLLWMRYSRAPQYSLARLAKAAEAGDWQGVQDHLDVRAVGSHYVAVLLSNAGGSSASSSGGSAMGGGGGMGSGAPGKTGGSAMEKTFVSRFEGALQQSVEGRRLEGDSGLAGVLLAGRAQRVDIVGASVASATVEVSDGDGGSETVTLTMRRIGTRWRIMEMDGLSDLMGSLD